MHSDKRGHNRRDDLARLWPRVRHRDLDAARAGVAPTRINRALLAVRPWPDGVA
jgi:hypothetical protein